MRAVCAVNITGVEVVTLNELFLNMGSAVCWSVVHLSSYTGWLDTAKIKVYSILAH